MLSTKFIISDRLPKHIYLSFRYIRLIFLLAFSLIILRLWYLQVMKGDYFRNRSENNRLRTRYIPAPRGLIFDRQGKVLVRNRPSFNIEIVTEDTKNLNQTVKRLADILAIDEQILFDQLRLSKIKRRRFEPQLLLRDVDRDLLSKVYAHKYELEGVVVNVVPAREYLNKNFASHLIGYVREINSQQLQENAYSEYQAGDIVGQYGIEKEQEFYLQGKRGIQGVIVDATGTRIGESYFEPEKSGHNVYLTIDYALQNQADSILEGQRGTIILMHSRTGEILALSSKPDFDSNVFVKGISEADWNFLSERPFNRLSNRAIQGMYPPGSLFKAIVGFAGLGEKVVSVNKQIFCPGYFNLGRAKFHCHKAGGHGQVDLNSALAHSCNIYFYDLGLKLGVDTIHRYAEAFGFGQKTGIDLSQELSGTVPSTEWKKKNFSKKEDQRWYAGETPSVAVGQGALQVTPIQIARAYAALANRGLIPRPRVVKEVKSKDGIFNDSLTGDGDIYLPYPAETYEHIIKGLSEVVKSGTGSRAQLLSELDISVAGKTGTAQLRSYANIGKLSKEETLAWFAGFAPVKNPEVVVVVLLEQGGHGGESAAPLAKKMLETYFLSQR